MSLKFSNQGGSDREIKGYDYLSPSADAEKYKASSDIKAATLPPKVDLRAFMTDVEDQKSLSSCTANAVAGAYEYLVKKYLSKRAFDVSRLFIYYNARLRAGNEIEDKGSHIQYAVDSLMKIGACKEETWPYDLKSVNKKPDENSYVVAADFKIETKKFVPIKLEAWKQSLAEGYPIVFGTALFSSFDSCTPNKGIVSMPSPDETGRKAHGLHAMLCVGYSDIDKMFIVRNSWGDKWGDKGYCYMPYEYLMSEKFNLGDCWIFGRTTPIPDADDSWINDKKSVVDGGRGYNRDNFQFYKDSDYGNFDIWQFVDVYDYDDEVTEEYDELEYEGEGEYDDILGVDGGDEESDEEEDEDEAEDGEEEEEDDDEGEDEEEDEEEEEEEDGEEEEEEEDDDEREDEEEEEDGEQEEDEEDDESDEEEEGEDEEESDEEESDDEEVKK
ncbi:MAG: C1 family peptidase [Arcicella sp.]|nr:C1 family peptidase [Arcicella sp.]